MEVRKTICNSRGEGRNLLTKKELRKPKCCNSQLVSARIVATLLSAYWAFFVTYLFIENKKHN